MRLEFWKSFFEIGGVALLFLTFVFGAGLVLTVNRLNAIQGKELRDFKLKIEDEQQKTARAQEEAAKAQLALRKASAFAAMPRRIVMGDRNGDAKIREARFKELEKYADTPTTIIFVSDDEAELLANDIRQALLKAGWKSVGITNLASTPIPLGFIESGVQLRNLIEVNNAPYAASPPPGAKPPAVVEALFNLLNMDLGQEAAGTPFGVKWEPDAIVNGHPFGIIRYGIKFPENGLVITVGSKPTEQIFMFLPESSPVPKTN